jgi:DNA modification methylase
MSNCLTRLSRLISRARLHVKARDKTSETTARQAQTVTGAVAAGEGKVIATTRTSDPAATLYVGDARNVLAALPDGSANCIVTSPPYWAKRDYGVPGQYGHEPDPAAYAETLRAVFREARRVLANDGTCWLNLGDSYSAGGGAATGLHAYLGAGLVGRRAPGVDVKNLLGIPWRVASALQDDGWILRNAIVWHKPNAMPESVRDRLNCRHELIFLLVKQPRYWFDLDPIRTPHATIRPPCTNRAAPGGSGTRRPPRGPTGGTHPGGNGPPKYGPHSREITAARRYGKGGNYRGHPNGRNPGDVWSVPTRPYRGPHFAAFPVELPLRCIAAGCKPGGNVLDMFCGTGTTGIAARQLGRRFTGIELNPQFAALAAERLRHAAAPDPDGNEPEPDGAEGGSR